MTNLYIKLFANCIPVKGAKKFIICDLQRNDIYDINEGTYEILTIHNEKTVEEIKKIYGKEITSYINDIVSYITKNELGFLCEDPKLFPKINETWRSSSHITNAIIEFSKESQYEIKNVFNQLSMLNCEFIEIRFYDKISISFLKKVIENLKTTTFQSVYVILKYNNTLTRKLLENFLLYEQRITVFIIHSSVKEETIKSKYLENSLIYYTSDIIKNNSCCGNIAREYFSCSLKMHVESKNHNSCLNRKMSIGVDGKIKNCPSMITDFGKIEDIKMKDALNKKDFKKYWNIKKDDIDVCKDCEFRYICSDCRAFTEDPNNDYSKPLKCGYDPYTGIWDDWTKNPLKKKAMEHYQKLELL